VVERHRKQNEKRQVEAECHRCRARWNWKAPPTGLRSMIFFAEGEERDFEIADAVDNPTRNPLAAAEEDSTAINKIFTSTPVAKSLVKGVTLAILGLSLPNNFLMIEECWRMSVVDNQVKSYRNHRNFANHSKAVSKEVSRDLY
jgi:hypothetical protein